MQEYPVAVLKPDTIRDSLDEVIIAELLQEWITVRFRKILQISEPQVLSIYPERVNSSRYKYMVHSLTHGTSMLLLLSGDNAYSRVNVIKWNWNKWWLRQKYLFYDRERLTEMWFSWEALQFKLAENRIHSCDNDEESALMLSGLLNRHEIDTLKSISPLLYRLTVNKTALSITENPNYKS